MGQILFCVVEQLINLRMMDSITAARMMSDNLICVLLPLIGIIKLSPLSSVTSAESMRDDYDCQCLCWRVLIPAGEY